MLIESIRVNKFGDADQLKIEKINKPEPQAGEVLVRVYAAGVNPIDWKIRQGYLKDFIPIHPPYTPGADLAGIIEEVGPGVTAFKQGQAVFGQGKTGTYAEFALAAVESLALKPQTINFDQAAAIPIGATTAWQALFDYGELQKGQRVLIQGAAGGVGSLAVQFAHWKGAHVFATASAENHDFLQSLGAEKVIDYHATDVESVARDFDLVLDAVGGKALAESYKLVKRGGILVTITAQEDQEKAKEYGITAKHMSAQVSGKLLSTFAQMIDEGKLKISLQQTFPLNNAPQAHQLSQTGHGRGRIVLHIAD